jgi:hypothetical protein
MTFLQLEDQDGKLLKKSIQIVRLLQKYLEELEESKPDPRSHRVRRKASQLQEGTSASSRLQCKWKM